MAAGFRACRFFYVTQEIPVDPDMPPSSVTGGAVSQAEVRAIYIVRRIKRR
jgi:hypothetical protein